MCTNSLKRQLTYWLLGPDYVYVEELGLFFLVNKVCSNNCFLWFWSIQGKILMNFA